MTNLVLLRELIRNEHAPGHSDNINNTFAWAGFESLFEGIIARGALPHSPIDIALCFSVMGVKTIHACARLGPNITTLRRWYTETASRDISLEITPTRYPAFTAALERVHCIALRTSPQIADGPYAATINSITRPVTLIHRDRILRNSLANAPATHSHKRHGRSHKSQSPRSMVTSTSTNYPSSQDRSQASQPSEHSAQQAPQLVTPIYTEAIPEPETDDESVFTREKSPTGLDRKDTFSEDVERSVITLANEFRDTSSPLAGLTNSKIPDDKIALLVIEAVTTRSKSLAPTKSILRHVNGMLQFYLDTRNETSVALTGESSLVLIRDYLESLSERGRTVPAAGRHALTVWPETLGSIGPSTIHSYCPQP